jgi:hypothetical protein
VDLRKLFQALAEVFDGPEAIEKHAQDALLSADYETQESYRANALTAPFLGVMAEADAHPVCNVIAETPLPWAPPQTSSNPLYVAHSLPKVNVELLGPDGLVKSNSVRLGLYGMLPNFEYGIRTHFAEEVFVMLAGSAFWKRGFATYKALGPGQRSYHPSMMQHANKTEGTAFLSAYVWHGDISTASYVYAGIPAN